MKSLNERLIEEVFKKDFTLVDHRPEKVSFVHTRNDGSSIEITDTTGKKLPETFFEPILVTIRMGEIKLMEIRCKSLESFLQMEIPK